MKVRQSIVEYCIHIFISQANLLQEDCLDLIDTPSNVYMICKRRRIVLKPDPVHKNVYNFFVKHGDDYSKIYTSWLVPNTQTVNIKYPFTKFNLINNCTGQLMATTSSALLCKLFRAYGHFDECKSYYNERICHECHVHGTCYDKCLDLEVIYIGQSFNSNTRLSSAHKTLQKINSDMLINEPDHEVWIILLGNFIVKTHITMSDGINDNLSTSALNTKFVNNIEKKEVINLVEAGLINYFKPAYNKIYKHTFPSQNHKSYPFSYKHNINTLSLELNTSYVVSRTCSKEIPANILHMPMFQLFDKQYKHLYEF